MIPSVCPNLFVSIYCGLFSHSGASLNDYLEVSNDGHEFPISSKIVYMSDLLSTKLLIYYEEIEKQKVAPGVAVESDNGQCQLKENAEKEEREEKESIPKKGKHGKADDGKGSGNNKNDASKPESTEKLLFNSNGIPIEVTNISSHTLRLMIHFCLYYLDVEYMKCIERGPLHSYKMSDNVQVWYAKYASQRNKNELFELLMAAEYFKIPTITNLCGPSIASRMRGMSVKCRGL